MSSTPWRIFCLSILLVGCLRVEAAPTKPFLRAEKVVFPPGKSTLTLTGRIKGRAVVDYLISAQAGNSLGVLLEANKTSVFFNLLPPNSETAIFNGSISGAEYRGKIAQTGEQTVRVYLMPNAARRGIGANYTLHLSLAPPNEMKLGGPSKLEVRKEPFDSTLALEGIQFHVTSPNRSQGNRLRIEPAGLTGRNESITQSVDGQVTGAEVADLNADGSPEIYVYLAGADAEAKGSLVAYAANHKKSLSQIYLPPVGERKENARGYRGEDEFAVVESTLVRRFPIFPSERAISKPTKKTRQLQYKLRPGEAGWVLRLDRVVEY